jgi:hypothetical protein
MSVELSIIKGFALGIEYVNGEDVGDEEVSVYVVVDLGFLRFMFTTYKAIV